jgi:predicted nucleic acid-binding protein
VDAAIRAITPFTQAEVRSGAIKAGWGERRVTEVMRALEACLLIPLDPSTVEEWARLRTKAESAGVGGLSDNDLWIAATASARLLPLVTADRDQARLEPLLNIEVVWLPPDP